MHYSVTLVSAADPSSELTARAMNESGDFVALQSTGLIKGSVVYHDGSLTKLPRKSPLDTVYASTIADNADVGGYVIHPGQIERAVWFHNGIENILPDSGSGALVTAGNGKGTLVGYVNEDYPIHAAVWQDGKLSLLKRIPGVSSLATAINDAGEIVGQFKTSSGRWQAFSDINGIVHNLQADGYTMTGVTDVNDSGDVIGVGRDPIGAFSNFAIVAGHAVPLAALPGSNALGGGILNSAAINDAGHIVGSEIDPQGNSHALLFDDGKAIDLQSLINPKLGYTLNQAVDVNSHGTILAVGRYGGRQESFILTPQGAPQAIPLPAPVWTAIATLPLVAFGLRARRRA